MAALPTPIEDAVRVLRSRGDVLDVRVNEADARGQVVVEADFDTNLPSTWAAEGRSPSGVLPVETVHFAFPPSYPAAAPIATLRPDFNAALPHINPHRAGSRVPPCLVYDSLAEVLHRDGFGRIAQQMAVWLSNAVMGSLIDLERGWEPSRRTTYGGQLEVDVQRLVIERPRDGGLMLFRAFAGWFPKRDYVTARALEPVTGPIQAPLLKEVHTSVQASPKSEIGRILVAVCWPLGPQESQPIFHTYQPDTVTNLAELRARAAELRCEEALDQVLNIGKMMKGQGIDRLPPVIILLPVARPAKLLGLQTNVEFLGYAVDVQRDSRTTNIKVNTSAAAIDLITPVSADLLRRASGLLSDPARFRVAFVGCGSFGSKIAMHMVRAGHCPSLLVDPSSSSAHHVARHAFLPADTSKFQSKVDGLRSIIESFALGSPAVYDDPIQILPSKLFDEHLKGDSRMVVNTTASAAVRDYLTQSAAEARVVEVCGFERGTCAVLTVEGEKRSPTTADLMTYAYERMRLSGVLPDPASTHESLLNIGVGCNSVTLPMPDARLSLITAGAGQFLLDALSNGLAEMGRVSVGAVGADGMSIQWDSQEVGKTIVVEPSYSEAGWSVRVLEPVHREILDACAEYPDVETGGIIVGRVSTNAREVTITGILPAPRDSTRSKTSFVLGVDGRNECIQKYEQSAKGVLWVLGTWHSHLHPEGPSPTDLATAALLELVSSRVSVLLIRRPDGYSAVVRG